MTFEDPYPLAQNSAFVLILYSNVSSSRKPPLNLRVKMSSPLSLFSLDAVVGRLRQVSPVALWFVTYISCFPFRLETHRCHGSLHLSFAARESHILSSWTSVWGSAGHRNEPSQQGCSSQCHFTSLELQFPLFKSFQVLNKFFYFKLNLNFTYLKVKNSISH